MYYESVDSRFHAALWSCRERFTCNYAISTGPNNDALKMYICTPPMVAIGQMLKVSLKSYNNFDFSCTYNNHILTRKVSQRGKVSPYLHLFSVDIGKIA